MVKTFKKILFIIILWVGRKEMQIDINITLIPLSELLKNREWKKKEKIKDKLRTTILNLRATLTMILRL